MKIMQKRKIWYSISALFIIPGLLAIAFWGLKPSIDFTGGSRMELSGTIDVDAAREFGEENELSGVVVQKIGDNSVSLRFAEINEEKHKEIKGTIQEKLGDGVSEVAFETVGPTISSETTRSAFISVGLAALIIILYVAISFRKVPKPASSWEFGFAAIAALAHDTIIVIGAFAIMGRYMNVEVDPLFITGLLTVIGFSVHDTIVIFDRIRENLIKKGATDYEEVVNLSVSEMLPRTINTTFLVWAILLILFLFGGTTIKYFVLTLVIGVAAGTYSSILNASPLLVTWQNFKKNRSTRR